MFLASTITTFFTDNWLSVLIAAIVGIFGGGGIAALLKARPEGSKILVDAAQGAVIVQSSVMNDLREEIARLVSQNEKHQSQIEKQEAEITELRSHMAEMNNLRGLVRDLEHQNEILIAENTTQASQIAELTRRFNENGYNK